MGSLSRRRVLVGALDEAEVVGRHDEKREALRLVSLGSRESANRILP